MTFHLRKFIREQQLFDSYSQQAGLRQSAKRRKILETFLSTEGHLTIEDLQSLLAERDVSVDLKTLKNALKLMIKAGVAHETHLNGDDVYYEHIFAHPHHDHLVCRKCGEIIEFTCTELEHHQEEAAKRHGFTPDDHRLTIFGVCGKCASKAKLPAAKTISKKEEEQLVSLVSMKPGDHGVVREVKGGGELARRMASLGIRVDKALTKVNAMLMEGPVIVSVDGRQIAIGYKMAQKVMVDLA